MRTLSVYIFIICILLLVVGNTGIWYMPNISAQYLVSQSLTSNPILDPNAHYIFTNYLEPLVFWIFGGNTLNEYLLYTLLVTIVFISIFVVWFLKYNSKDMDKNYYKIIPIITFPIFFVPFYWIGMDGMTLLLMLLIMIYCQSRWGIVFPILLGMQHFEQGIVGFLLLLGSLFIYNFISRQDKKWMHFKKILYIILGVIVGKLILLSCFYILGIEILGNRATYLVNHLKIFSNQWLASWPYILFSLFGLGWLLILKNLRKTYPLLLASIIALIFIITVADQTRVGTIILFPSVFYWIFMNREIFKDITIKFSILVLALYLLLPVVYVWGYPFGSLLKYNVNLIKNIKSNEVDFMLPFRRNSINKFNSIIYNASQLNSNCGTNKGEYRIALQNVDKAGYITFGPYIKLEEGDYKFNIAYISSEANNTSVGSWDVAIELPNQVKVIKQGDLIGSNGSESHITQTFNIPNEYNNRRVEIRNFYNGTGNLTIKSLTVTRVQ